MRGLESPGANSLRKGVSRVENHSLFSGTPLWQDYALIGSSNWSSLLEILVSVGIALVFWATRCGTPLLGCYPSLKRAPFVVKRFAERRLLRSYPRITSLLYLVQRPLSAFLVPLSSGLVSRLPLLSSPRRRGVSDLRLRFSLGSSFNSLARKMCNRFFCRSVLTIFPGASFHFWHSNDLDIRGNADMLGSGCRLYTVTFGAWNAENLSYPSSALESTTKDRHLILLPTFHFERLWSFVVPSLRSASRSGPRR